MPLAAAGLAANVAIDGDWVGDAELAAAVDRVLMPLARAFDPQLVVLSLGTDSGRGDPIGDWDVTPAGYALAAHALCALGAPLVVALEGGYHLATLAASPASGLPAAERLALAASVAAAVAPAAQFLNEFLRTERGFSGILIAVFVLATNTPGGIGIVVGGKLADRHGRRIIGAIGIAGGVLFTVVSYLSWGWPLWLASVAAAVIGAIAVPALAVYGPELFPTSQRGTANGGLQVVAVAGSSLGLLTVGWLADRVGGLGHAMAIVAIAPALLVIVVLFWFPETARRELEELNPSDHEHNE
jgi:MFS family permease